MTVPVAHQIRTAKTSGCAASECSFGRSSNVRGVQEFRVDGKAGVTFISAPTLLFAHLRTRSLARRSISGARTDGLP